MKPRQKNYLGYSALAAIILISAGILPLMFPFRPKDSVAAGDIVSYCVGETEKGGAPELLAIVGSSGVKTDDGERCGDTLLVCGASANEDITRLGYIPPDKIIDRIDLKGINPLKVQVGDVNGDGVNEVALCVYKTAKFHPVMAKRPFFFDLINGNLVPVWLGSRLSRPFDNYVLYDINNDSVDEIVSIERLEDGGRIIAVYDWKGFGFEMLTQSLEYEGKLSFASNTVQTDKISVILSDNREQKRLEFRLNDMGNEIIGDEK